MLSSRSCRFVSFSRPFSLRVWSILLITLVVFLGNARCQGEDVLPLPTENPLSRIAFGSCGKVDRPQPIWTAVVAARPDVFVFAGDNIYADTEDMNAMRAKYAKLAAKPGFQKLLKRVPVLATWDDHDYGEDNAGAEYKMRVESQKVFLVFFGEPKDSQRLITPGIYDAKLIGPKGKRTQILLLDTRYFRSPLNQSRKPRPKLLLARAAGFDTLLSQTFRLLCWVTHSGNGSNSSSGYLRNCESLSQVFRSSRKIAIRKTGRIFLLSINGSFD